MRAAAHRLPAGMTDIDGVDEGIAHQAADQADDAVGSEHARGRIFVAGGFRALDIVHGLDEVIDTERNGGDEDDAEEFEAGEDVDHRRDRHREAEIGERGADARDAQSAEAKTEEVRAPGDDHAGRDGDETRRDAAPVFHPAEPAHQNDGEADETDLRRHVHLERRAHRDEGDGDAGERAEQRRARRDSSNERRDEAADHENKTLEEHPDEAGRPALERIAGLDRDRQHDHEGDDEHVRHADARGQRADIGAAGPLREAVGEVGVIECRQAHHQPECGQDAAEHEAIGHLQHEAQEARENQHVDEDVGAEAEKRVPVARCP
ncbi:hypothetical protein ABIA29_000688 [Bradyrhizobium japonicum]